MLKLLLAAIPVLAVPLGAIDPVEHSKAPVPWCAADTETLPGNVCHFDASTEGRRTLVIFFHGVVPKNADWQWTQQHAMMRDARHLHFEVLMPQGFATGSDATGLYAWPGSLKGTAGEDELLASLASARRLLEKRNGKPFDEVFVAGFSSGAYFATSLALRGRLDVDGYALFAGGASLGRPSSEVRKRPPIFVGVSTHDSHSASDARGLGASLRSWGWPHWVDEEPFGHLFADLHVNHAIGYLRRMVDRAR